MGACHPFSFGVPVNVSSVSVSKEQKLSSVEAYIQSMIAYRPVYQKYQAANEIYELAIERASRDLYLGMLFVAHADKTVYGTYQTKIHDDFVDGYSHYPSSVNDAFRLLNERTPVDANVANGRGGGGNGR